MEIAVSLALLAGSSLMFRSVMKLLRTDLGISAGQVLNGGLTMRQNRYPDAAARLAFFDRLTARLGAVPGVESVGLTTSWPMQQPGQVPVEAQDSPAGAGRAAVHAVSADYFASLRIPIVAGRPFARSDRLGSEAVAIVSESLARRLWPGGRPVGSRIVVRETRGQNQEVAVARVVVGVVRDVQQDPADRELADLYVALLQEPSRSAFLLVRTAGAPSSWIAPLRAALRDIDPELALNRPRPLQAIVDEITARPRFLAVLLGSFAAAAALLALVGVYGVVAYAVRQREREIAVRLAIGADPGRVTRLFVRQGSLILAAGIALGLLAAVGAGRLIESQLFDVSPHDPAALGLAAAAFGTAGLLAVWWPSRRAAMTDPAIALRAE
jgi:putative ABC transport system permease protein